MSKRPPRLCTDPAEFASLTYAKRQFIVVVEDEVMAAALKLREKAVLEETKRIEEEKREAEDDDPIWEDALNLVRKPIGHINAGSLPLGGMADAHDDDKRDKLDVLALTNTTASSLILPPGHPRFGVLYVGHPVLSNHYYTAASFHRLTFEHKFSEALRLLMALGATRVKVEWIRGWFREFATDANVVKVSGGGGGSRRGGESKVFFEARLEGASEPSLPDNMVWYPYEPTWQVIAEGRLKYGIKNFKLIIEYADDFNVNAKLSTMVKKIGLDLGGQFTDFQTTVWHIDGEFPAVDEVNVTE